MCQKRSRCITQTISCHHLWWQKHNIAVSLVTERWAVPAEANLPPASLRGWCSEVTPLGRRALDGFVCVCVCLFIDIEYSVCVCVWCSKCVFFALSFLCEFWWLRIQFKYSFRCVLVSHCVCASKLCVFECVCVYSVMFCALLPTPTSPSPPCAPPYLSPMEMHRGQGIWGEEHREAALHNLKGILMNQHSRTDYSHDNRPQTNSCIWSPLVLWLWKYCMCVCVRVRLFLFFGYSMCLLRVCVSAQVSTSTFFSLRNWPGNWFTLMSTQEDVIIVCYDQR